MTKSKVYFSREISPAALLKVYAALDVDLPGKVAIKISTGEAGNPHYLQPDLIRDLVQKLNGTIVECNTAYAGARNTTAAHLKTIEDHGFTKIAPVDIMDAEGEIEIPVHDSKHLEVDIIGQNFPHYDSMLNLAHFKGHPMGGFGGALKNQSIGIASAAGKAYIHTAGLSRDVATVWSHTAPQDDFLESMAEAVKAVADYMAEQGKPIAYLNVINNLSVDCDCSAHPEAPCMADIGIAASLDPVALDQACLDLIYQSNDAGRDHFVERVERQNGQHLIDTAAELSLGSKDYELITLD